MQYQGFSRKCRSRSKYSRLLSLLSFGLVLIIVFNARYRILPLANAAGPPSCLTVSASGAIWQNLAFVGAQSGSFTAEMAGTPLGNGIDAGIGLSNGAQTAFTGLACIARYNTTGTIDARNGGGYAAVTTIPYSGNTTYHFRFVVNVPAHTYSLYATPSGGVEEAVGVNYAFRTEQATVSSLNYWSMWGDIGSMQGCGFVAPCYTAAAGVGWIKNAFAPQRP